MNLSFALLDSTKYLSGFYWDDDMVYQRHFYCYCVIAVSDLCLRLLFFSVPPFYFCDLSNLNQCVVALIIIFMNIITTYPTAQGCGGVGPYPSCHWTRHRVHPGYMDSPSEG